MTKPTVLFLCPHNAGRSQMAMGFFGHLAGDRAHAYSGGSEPADQVNTSAIAAMAEKGIDIGRTTDAVDRRDGLARPCGSVTGRGAADSR
jgi:arsenate reductase